MEGLFSRGLALHHQMSQKENIRRDIKRNKIGEGKGAPIYRITKGEEGGAETGHINLPSGCQYKPRQLGSLYKSKASVLF